MIHREVTGRAGKKRVSCATPLFPTPRRRVRSCRRARWEGQSPWSSRCSGSTSRSGGSRARFGGEAFAGHLAEAALLEEVGGHGEGEDGLKAVLLGLAEQPLGERPPEAA